MTAMHLHRPEQEILRDECERLSAES